MEIGRLFGIKIILTESFLVLLAAYCILGMGDLAVIAFAAVFLHEAGHSLFARKFSLPVASILLFPFGGVAEIAACRNFTVRKEIIIALAGPMVNLCLAAGSQLFSFPQLDFAVRFNLLMGGINLIPGLPLDGGRILRALLSDRLGYLKATRLLTRAGQFWAVGFFFFGIWQIFIDWGNCCWLFAAVYFFYAARRERNLSFLHFVGFLANREQTPEPLEGLLITALDSTKIIEVLSLICPGKRMMVSVLDARGDYLGILPERSLIRAALSGGFERTVGEILFEVSNGESRNLFPGC